MSGPIRILHAVVNMNRGGAETLLMNLYRNIDRSIVQFDFLTCKEGVFDKEILELGGRIHRIPYVTDVGHNKYIQALDRFFFEQREYTIVHSHMDKMSGFVLRSAKKAGIAVRIAHSHNTSSEGGLAAKAYKWVAGKLILPSATHLLACSGKAAEWLFSNKREKAIIMKNGIEWERFVYSPKNRAQVREELDIVDATFVLGHVGRFFEQKNHSFLIEVFAELNKQAPDTVLVLVGDGSLRMEMEKKAAACGITGKVRFLGIRHDISRLLQGFDVFVFPSLHEGLPVTLVEAQAAGLPCLISDVITPEVDLGIKLVDSLPLSDKEVWMDKIRRLMQDSPARVINWSLSTGGYDIKHTAAWAEGFYSSVSR